MRLRCCSVQAASIGPALVVAALVGCAGDQPRESPSESNAPGAPLGQIRISAASSLTGAFQEMESAFESAHPGSDVMLNFGGSSLLQLQVLEGAPVDVYAPADLTRLSDVMRPGSGRPVVFARTRMQIAVPVGNPAGVSGLTDFADPALRLGLCAPGVPCGDLARRVLNEAGVAPALDTHEPNVRALLTRVELGELDAAITYVTDVASAVGRVDGIDIPEALNVAAEYPIGVLPDAPNPAGARAFVDFVLSSRGRAILARHGFELP